MKFTIHFTTVLICCLCAARCWAQQSTFADLQTAFNSAETTTFGVDNAPPWKTKALFLTRPFVATVVQATGQKAGLIISFEHDEQNMQIEPMKVQINTGGNDCSVNHFCGSCSGGGLGRAWCEAKRGTCAAAKSPEIGLCAAEKALNGVTLVEIDFSGADLSLNGTAKPSSINVDPALADLSAQTNVNASGQLSGTQAKVSIFPVLGFLVGCPVPPTYSVPTITAIVSNLSLPLDAPISLTSIPSGAPNSLAVSMSIQPLQFDADIDTGNLFNLIAHNPAQVISCTIPSLASFTAVTMKRHYTIKWAGSSVNHTVATFTLTRNAKQLAVMPKQNALAVGVVEVQP